MALLACGRKILQTLWRGILDFVYPRHCPICQLRLSSYEMSLCANCAINLAPYKKETYHANERLYASPLFRELYALFRYEKGSYVQKLIHQFKYHSHTDLIAFFLSKAKHKAFLKEWKRRDYDLVVAVPLSSKKYKKRGYNQAFLMAEAIAKELNIKASEQIIKHKETKESQTRLSKNDRILNTEHSFYINPKQGKEQVPKRVLLVDDVLTTGATLLAVSFLLEELGVEEIDVFTIAVAM